MSKEFEEIVLKKLDTLEDKTSNTDKVMQEIVLKKLDTLEDKTSNTDKVMQEIVLKKLDALEDKTNNTDKVMQEIILKKLDALEDKTSNTDKVMQEIVLKKLDALEDKTTNTDNEIKSMKSDMQSLQESVKNLNNNFTVFDFEINKKIDTLFDAITANNEKHEVFEKSIVSLNTKTFNHDIRISVLEDYSKNTKLFATN